MVKGVKWDTTGRRPSGRLDVMEIDVGDDKGCAYQTVRDVGGYRDLSVRVLGGDVGRAVELTGTKKRVGWNAIRDLAVHTDTASIGPIVEERGTKNLVGWNGNGRRGKRSESGLTFEFDVPHSTVVTPRSLLSCGIFVRPISINS